MRRLVAMGTILCAIASFGPGAHAADPSPSSSVRRGVQTLLNARAHAIRTHDLRGFLATVSGPRSFRERQKRFFRGVTSLPLGSYSLHAAWGRYGDLVRPVDRARHGDAGAVSIPLTQERYRLRGFDTRPAEEDMFYTFVKTGKHWSIVSDSDVAEIGFVSARGLWDFGKIAVGRLPGLLVLRGECSEHVPGDCVTPPPGLPALEAQGTAQVDRFWPGKWSHRVVLIEPASEAEVRLLLQAGFPIDNFVAFAFASLDVARGFRLTGSRIVLNPPVIAGRDSANVLITVSHELVHIATRDRAGPFTPAWVDEGIAEYIAYSENPSSLDYLRTRIASGQLKAELPPDYEFTTGSGSDIYGAYQRAESAVGYFIQRWGIQRFVSFYKRLGSVRIAVGTAGYQVDAALRRTVGIGLDTFRRAWAASIGA